MKTITCCLIAIALTCNACVTCRRHPTACEAGGVAVIGIAIAAVGAAQANQRHGFWSGKPTP